MAPGRLAYDNGPMVVLEAALVVGLVGVLAYAALRHLALPPAVQHPAALPGRWRVAHYDEIHSELRFALMQLGRMLKEHVSKTRRVADEMKKREYISKYIPKISEALQKILEFDDKERDRTTAKLTEVLNRRSI